MPQTAADNEPTPAVAVVSAGWLTLADAALYYPEDLPEEWRLAYFANEHAGVYLPAAAWGVQSAATLHAWRADVHEEFAFFLELPQQPAIALERMETARQALDEKLLGWVSWPRSPGPAGTLLESTIPATSARSLGRVVTCPQALLADLRAGARWLQAHAAFGASTLVILMEPSSGQLRDWRRLAQLLGFAELSTPGPQAARPAARKPTA